MLVGRSGLSQNRRNIGKIFYNVDDDTALFRLIAPEKAGDF